MITRYKTIEKNGYTYNIEVTVEKFNGALSESYIAFLEAKTDKEIQDELKKIDVMASEKKADKLLKDYYEKCRSKYVSKTLFKPMGIGAAIGGAAGVLAAGATGGASIPMGATTGFSIGYFVGLIKYCKIIGKISEEFMDLDIEVSEKRRFLEKMLRDIEDDIDNCKNKKAKNELIKSKNKIRRDLDRVKSIKTSPDERQYKNIN